jgi:hypothetical protein
VTAPHAPWKLLGECVVAVARRPRGAVLPDGVDAMPGPAVVLAARYDASPVGPFSELAVALPARVGLRPGWCLTTDVVDLAAARVGGRLNWGYPKELGSLVWDLDGDERELRWVERGITVRVHPRPGAFPLFVPYRHLQRRADGPVVIPTRLRGKAHRATVEVHAGENDPLVWLAGPHRGVFVSGAHMVLDPARLPAGLTSTLRAPLTAPEPAMSGCELAVR